MVPIVSIAMPRGNPIDRLGPVAGVCGGAPPAYVDITYSCASADASTPSENIENRNQTLRDLMVPQQNRPSRSRYFLLRVAIDAEDNVHLFSGRDMLRAQS